MTAEMSCCPVNISEAYIQERDIGKYDQDIAQIRNRPEVSQVDTGQGTADTEGCDKDTCQTNGVDDSSLTTDTVCGNLRETDHANQAGKGEQAETETDQKSYDRFQ